MRWNGPRQANLVLIAYASSEGSGEPAHPRSLARTSAARSIQAVNQEEPSDRKPDPWSLWMAGHAQLKFVMTECSKTQIRLAGLKCKYLKDFMLMLMFFLTQLNMKVVTNSFFFFLFFFFFQFSSRLRKIPELEIIGDSQVSVVAFGSKKFNIFRLSDALAEIGWSLNPLQFPPW